MSKEGFDRILGRHCAPTFTGLKAASLIVLPCGSYAKCETWLKQYALSFYRQGIKFLVLATTDRHVLLLIYRERMLTQVLDRPEARRLLVQYGYPQTAGLAELLAHLQMRCGQAEGFPHEIGLFLDYPPADVQGFISQHGQNFLYAGYWKIYVNEQATRALFAQFSACAESFCRQLDRGIPMEQLLAAV